MAKTLTERFPKPKEEDLTDEVKAAIQAMNRASEKMLQRKRALGHKVVVWENGKSVIKNP